MSGQSGANSGVLSSYHHPTPYDVELRSCDMLGVRLCICICICILIFLYMCICMCFLFGYHPTIILAANEHLASSLHHPSENPSTEEKQKSKRHVFFPPLAEVG